MTNTSSPFLMKCVAFLLLVVLGGPLQAADAVYSQIGRVVAIGDLHGDYEQYIRLLQDNDLVDEKLRWKGGDTHLVQLGDVTDRGPDSLKIIRHLMKMEKQAQKNGGYVHVLIGNHEAMNVQTDLRYVHPGEYSVLVSRKSEKLQKRYIDAVLKATIASKPELKDKVAETRASLVKRYPLGYVEHRMLWEPGNEMANWYGQKNTVIKINDKLYLHGGLDPHAESYPSLDEINDTVRAELERGARPQMSVSPRGPLWYRGLAKHDAETELAPLEQMLDHYGATTIIIGHTPSPGVIIPRFDGKVIRADVGISAHYGSGQANVLIENGKAYSIHRGEKILLPDDDGLDAYLDQIYEIEPGSSKYRRWFETRREKSEATEEAVD